MRLHFVILLITLITSEVSANRILDAYRFDGIKNVEKILDNQLTSPKVWEKVISDLDTKFGYIEAHTTFLACDKEKATLELYVRDKENKFQLQNSYKAFTGKMDGDKQREGDLKTPDGIYTLKRKIDNVDSFYGPMAFVTSYPNIYDKIQGKNGSGIWIHGLPLNQERDTFTKGCIAINNNDITCLDEKMLLKSTLLMIDEKINLHHTKKELSQILASLYQWRYAWIYNDLELYLSFYSTDFIHSNGKKYHRFVDYKTRVFSYNDKKTIIFSKIAIVPYPSKDKNLFQVRFYEKYKSRRSTFNGNKILIVELINNTMKIVTEK